MGLVNRGFRYKYRLLDEKIYPLIAIPLFFTIIGLIYLVLTTVTYLTLNPQAIPEQELSLSMAFISFGAVYVVSSAIASYMMYSALHDHIFYSVTETILELSEKEELKIKYILNPEYTRSKLPSPITALILTLFTGGIAFPVMIYLFEKRIRSHDAVESKIKGLRSYSQIDIGNFLLDLILLVVTLGLWLGVWIWRAITIYNRHIKSKHLLSGIEEIPSLTPRPMLIIPLILLSMSILVFLSIMNIPVIPLPQLFMAFLMAYTAYVFRRKKLVYQVAALIVLQYTILGTIGLVGFFAYNFYSPLLTAFERLSESLSRDFLSLILTIFQNNIRITIFGLIPFIGPLIAGYAIGNTAFLFGLIVYEKPPALSLFLMPHTFLEFLSYSLSVAIATRIPIEGRRLLPYALISIAILFIGAIVESIFILMTG
ncbi:MAG: hypothetical protein DRO40_06485 [Thermoprotei archaeon]|nr:MAG: hypothetical protein DRO40_06485 [Thermoprotei archaeon]